MHGRVFVYIRLFLAPCAYVYHVDLLVPAILCDLYFFLSVTVCLILYMHLGVYVYFSLNVSVFPTLCVYASVFQSCLCALLSMYFCICLYVCLYASLFACGVCLCLILFLCACLSACINVCLYDFLCVYMCVPRCM